MIEDSEPHREMLPASRLPPGLDPIRLLGHGAMAAVYLARDRALKRLVAVKVLRDELCRDPVCRQRFEREAQAAARLTHPAITRVYSVGRLPDDTPFIVMEYVAGDNLADRLESRGAVGVDEARRILLELADALAAAHAANIVHRDVKPANVLIEHDTGRVCLTDFGVAAILGSGSEAMTRLTREDDRLGDPRYMSPEQLRGETVTRRSDIYGLGIVGYELLTGRGPFDHVDSGDPAAAHLRRLPVDLSTIGANLPADLAGLLRRCLAKRPELRPRAADVRASLRGEAGALQSPVAGPLASFLAELRQRKVYRAAAGYAAFVFLLLQAADLVLPTLGAPSYVYRAIVIGSLGGFPLTVALAWLFDYREGRLVRTADDAETLAGGATAAQRRVMKWLGLGVSVAGAALLGWWLLAYV